MSRPFDFGSGDDPVDASVGRRPTAEPGGSSLGPGLGTTGLASGETTVGFGGLDPHVDGAVAVGNPPVRWLLLGIAVAVIGAVIAALFEAIVPSVLAWVLAGPVAIGLLTVFILGDNKNRSAPVYAVRGFVPWLYRGLLVVSLIGVVLGALRIAVWVGHL